jgi:hypothetical protein
MAEQRIHICAIIDRPELDRAVEGRREELAGAFPEGDPRDQVLVPGEALDTSVCYWPLGLGARMCCNAHQERASRRIATFQT